MAAASPDLTELATLTEGTAAVVAEETSDDYRRLPVWLHHQWAVDAVEVADADNKQSDTQKNAF